jgi:hypothetical protein
MICSVGAFSWCSASKASHLKQSSIAMVSGEAREEEMEPLLTCVDVVCREISSFKNQPLVVRRVEAFLDYSPQYSISQACQDLPIRLAERVLARRGWDEEDVVAGLADAAWEGRLDVIQWLCAKGEQVAGLPTSELVKKWNRHGYPLNCATQEGNLEIMQWLVEKGAPVNQKDATDSTPLIEAACRGNLSAVQWLLTQNADVNAKDRDGITPLLGAVGSGSWKMVAVLLKAGANLHDQSKTGRTALHIAVGSDVEEVRFLVGNGVEVAHTDNSGRTALYYASTSQNFEVVEFLLECFDGKQPPVDDTRRCFFEAAKAGRTDLLQSLQFPGKNGTPRGSGSGMCQLHWVLA